MSFSSACVVAMTMASGIMATSPNLLDFAREAGRQAVRIAQLENMRSSDIVTMDSFENAHDERFQYRRFSSKVLLYRGEKLVYRDNTCYEPDKMPMEGIGMYEGYTHMANLLFFNMQDKASNLDLIREIIDNTPNVTGGASIIQSGDTSVKLLGKTAQELYDLCEKIAKAILD